MLGGLEFTGGLQHHFNNILHALNRRRGVFGLGGNNIHNPLGQLGDRRLGCAPKAGKTPHDRILDPLNIKGDNTPIALDNSAGEREPGLIHSGEGGACCAVYSFGLPNRHPRAPSCDYAKQREWLAKQPVEK